MIETILVNYADEFRKHDAFWFKELFRSPNLSSNFLNTFDCMSPYRQSYHRTPLNQNWFGTHLRSKKCRIIRGISNTSYFSSNLEIFEIYFGGENLKQQKVGKFQILFSGNVSETYSPFFNTVKVLSKSRFDAERTNVKNHCKL